jgi:hypothetical protein
MRNVWSTCESMAQHTSRVSSRTRKMLPNVGRYSGYGLSICLTKSETLFNCDRLRRLESELNAER